MRGETIVLRSDGKAVRDYLYIDDAVEAYLLLAQKLQPRTSDGWYTNGPSWGRAFNFPGQSWKVLDIVNLISLAMKYTGQPLVLDQSDDETQVLELATLDAPDVLGEYLKTSIADGLDKTIAWMRRTYGESRATRWKTVGE
jgi:CDP-glucose 4,6-dehydratase